MLHTLHPQTPKFWKVTRYFTRPQSSTPPLHHQGTQVYQAPHKAKLLAQQFERAHHLTQSLGSRHHTTSVSRFVTKFFCNDTPQTPPLQLTNPYEIKRKILSLKTRSAPGHDNISTTVLRHLSNKALKHFTDLFNHLLLKGHFPAIWKRGKVIPILKPRKPSSDPASYRPISLRSTLGKLFERIVADRLKSFTDHQKLLPQEQFGFRKRHSTVSQLARITDYVTHGYNLHKRTGMVLLDLEKAYNTIWIQGLLYKLITLNLPTYLLFIIKAFLEDRSFTVHLNKASSTHKFPSAGLPQGAVLSTTLFTLFISDIPHPQTQLWHCMRTTPPSWHNPGGQIL